MSRPRCVVASLLALLVGLVAIGAGPAGTALAASKPKISSVGSGAGPIAPTTIVIKGSHLSGAKAITFGSKKGSIVRVRSSDSVVAKTPRGAKAGTVSVRIKTAAGWSAKARYTFVAKPSLTRLSPTIGRYTGGQKLTLTGKNLSRTTKVLIGTAAASIVSRSSKKVVVTTPIGVLGKTKVIVTSPGGTSRSRSFTYVDPPRQSKATVDAAAGTYVAGSIDWVTGGYDTDTDTTNPWEVGLPKGANAPTVGQPFLVKPGSLVYPSGLAGSVDAVAIQGDDSLRVTVAPADLTTALDRYKLDYSGPLNEITTVGGKQAVETSIEFKLDRSALFCHDAHGQSVSFGINDLKMYVSDIDVSQHVDLGGLIHRPTLDATITTEVTTSGTFHVEGASTCGLQTAWANAHRLRFFLGGGATISVGPAFEFSVSGKGTVKLLDRTRTTWAVDAELGKVPQLSKTSRSIEHKIGGSFTFTATLAAGVEIRLGILDTAGVTGKIMLGISIDVQSVNLSNVCIDAKLVLKLSIGLFLDLWVKEWESPSLRASIDLFTFVHTCLAPETEPEEPDEPVITSARLPDAHLGAAYSAQLETADNRNGTWSIVRYALPAGLTLDRSNGEISGTPTSVVGDYPVIIDFKDGAGLVATTVIRIRVLPETGIGGGDIQATLQWTGSADLDLHVSDPSGEEIYYGHSTSESGGTLDHDANAACNGPEDDDNAVENVFWPPRSAPAGDYLSWVVVYNPCDGPLDWHLTVRRNGVVIIDQTGAGNSLGYAFSVGGAARGKAMGTRPVSSRNYPKK